MSEEIKKKYLVKSGYIISKNDVQRHFITTFKLIGLYKVSRSECILCDDIQGYSLSFLNSLILLKPRFDGNYKDYSDKSQKEEYYNFSISVKEAEESNLVLSVFDMAPISMQKALENLQKPNTRKTTMTLEIEKRVKK